MYRISGIDKDQIENVKKQSLVKMIQDINENHSELTQQVTGKSIENDSIMEVMTYLILSPLKEMITIKNIVKKLQNNSYNKDEIIEELKTLTFEEFSLS